MKTWEMIKALTENPEKRFRYNTGSESGVIENNQGRIIVAECSCKPHIPSELILHRGFMKVDWELVPQEVPWQDAIQAYLNKKDIRIECDGEIFLQSQCCKLGAFSNTDYKGIDEKLFRKGKWFIL